MPSIYQSGLRLCKVQRGTCVMTARLTFDRTLHPAQNPRRRRRTLATAHRLAHLRRHEAPT